MSLYVGVNGSPKKVTKLLVGVNGVPKEVNTGYTGGVNSSLNKVYSSKLDINSAINKPNPVDAIISGLITDDYIGRIITLSNSKCTCQEWIIIGVNCENTMGTVDLISKTSLWNKYGESGGVPYGDNVYLYGGNDQGYSTNGSSSTFTAVQGTKTGTANYYINNVLSGFTADIQKCLQTMIVKYCNSWNSGEDYYDYGSKWDNFYIRQKITYPGDDDICLEIGNGAYITGGMNGSYFGLRTDNYVGHEHSKYFDHSIEWYSADIMGGGSTYEHGSLKSYDTSQLRMIARTPAGSQVQYPLRSAAYNRTCSRYYIDTNGKRCSIGNVFYNSYVPGAIIRLGNPIYEQLRQIDPVDALSSGKITQDFVGMCVYLTNTATYDASYSLTKWVITNVSYDNGAVTLMSSISLKDINETDKSYLSDRAFGDTNVYRSSSLRQWLNNTFYNGFTNTVKNALHKGGYISVSYYTDDYVYAPSVTELGFNPDGLKYEGSGAFQLFRNEYKDFLDKDTYKHSLFGGSCWTRSISTSDSSKAYVVSRICSKTYRSVDLKPTTDVYNVFACITIMPK